MLRHSPSPKRHVALCSKVDGENTITPEDVGTQSGQARGTPVVRGLGDKVRLEEMNARGREFDDFRQVDRNEVFHLRLTHRGMLQDVDGRIVRVVSQHVAEGERVDDARRKPWRLRRTDARCGPPATERCYESDDRDRAVKLEVARRSQLSQYAGVDAVRTVCSRTHKSGKGLAQAIGHFLRDVLDGRGQWR